ncbi:MAG: hypothetical protein ACLS6G_10240 [Christensenellales bacterium]
MLKSKAARVAHLADVSDSADHFRAGYGTFNYLQNLEILTDGWYSLWTQHTLFYSLFLSGDGGRLRGVSLAAGTWGITGTSS